MEPQWFGNHVNQSVLNSEAETNELPKKNVRSEKRRVCIFYTLENMEGFPYMFSKEDRYRNKGT